MALERGSVIALRRNGCGLVWSIGTSHVMVVPIGGYNGPPPHRAEVRFEQPHEVFACGVFFKFPVVRCHMAFRMALPDATQAAVLGKAPANLLAKVLCTIKREVENQAFEARMHFNDRRTGFLAAQL